MERFLNLFLMGWTMFLYGLVVYRMARAQNKHAVENMGLIAITLIIVWFSHYGVAVKIMVTLAGAALAGGMAVQSYIRRKPS